MAYDPSLPLDNEHVATIPYWIRQKAEELKGLRIVDAGTLSGYSAGNATGNIPVSNGTINTNLNAEFLGGKRSSEYANSVHIHNNATTSTAGFMSNTDKTNFDAIKTWYDAEALRYYFGTITVGTTSLVAETRSDTLTITSDSYITLTPTAGTDSFVIGMAVDGNGKATHVHPIATGSVDGFMSTSLYSNLSAAYSHITDNPKHYNFGNVTAGGNTLSADTFQDTLTITAGTGISITSDTATDTIAIAVSDTLNANTVDGYHARSTSRNNVANEIVVTDASGYAQFGLINSNATVSSTAFTHYWGMISTDGYIRPKTLANVKTEIVTKAAVEAVLTGAITTHTHSYLPLSGGTLTGALTLYQDAVSPMQAVTKQQFDSHAGHMNPIISAIIFGG